MPLLSTNEMLISSKIVNHTYHKSAANVGYHSILMAHGCNLYINYSSICMQIDNIVTNGNWETLGKNWVQLMLVT